MVERLCILPAAKVMSISSAAFYEWVQTFISKIDLIVRLSAMRQNSIITRYKRQFVDATFRIKLRNIPNEIFLSLFQIIKVLIQSGAHLHGRAYIIGEKICAAAAVGNTKRLKSYQLANADLSQKDFSGRTPLHLAALHGKTQVIKFLLAHDVDTKASDKTNQSPYDLAKVSGSAEAVTLLS